MSRELDLLNLIAEEDPLLAQALINSAEQDAEWEIATLQTTEQSVSPRSPEGS